MNGPNALASDVQLKINQAKPSITAIKTISMPGPTGESNRLSSHGRGTILCLGPSADTARNQAEVARQNGCAAVMVAPGASGENAIDGFLPRRALAELQGFAAVALASDEDDLRAARVALASRDGPILPLLSEADIAPRCRIERHICIDTTAAGGNAALLAGQPGAGTI